MMMLMMLRGCNPPVVKCQTRAAALHTLSALLSLLSTLLSALCSELCSVLSYQNSAQCSALHCLLCKELNRGVCCGVKYWAVVYSLLLDTSLIKYSYYLYCTVISIFNTDLLPCQLSAVSTLSSVFKKYTTPSLA